MMDRTRMRDKEPEENAADLRREFFADASQNGMRLDSALAAVFPALGLRARRRLWERCVIKVDGKTAKPGFLLGSGQHVSIAPLMGAAGSTLRQADEDYAPRPELVACSADFCAFYKPDGLPSAHIAGRAVGSAQAYMAEHWRELAAGLPPEVSGATPPLLCNRLDTETSGLLLGAFSEAARQSFRAAEKEGMVDKRYYAFVHGKSPGTLLMDAALDTAKRKKTRVLPQVDPDACRHTSATLLAFFGHGPVHDYFGAAVSLLDIRIKRGARHQIRAHLAYAGWPIVGDALYSAQNVCATARHMYLHHYSINFQGFTASAEPRWEVWGMLPCGVLR